MSDYVFPWERLAQAGGEMPDGLPLEEQWAYQSMALLYGRFRMKLIDRQTGAAEKGKIGYELERRKRMANTRRRLLERHTKLTQDIEHAANAYRTERTLENADRLVDILDGFLKGESSC